LDKISKKIDGKKKRKTINLLKMSSPENRDAKFKALEIPPALDYKSSDKVPCNSGCPHCHGSDPGCFRSNFQKKLDPILRMIYDDSRKYGDSFVKNREIVHGFLRCRFSVSRYLASQRFYSDFFETERLRWISELKKIHSLIPNICCVSGELQYRVNRLFLVNLFGKTPKERGLILTRDQWKVVIPWLQDELPTVPMTAMKRLRMASMGFGILIKKFVPIEMDIDKRLPKHLQLMIFKRIFSERLLRKQGSEPYPLNRQHCLTMKDLLTQFVTPIPRIVFW
jgi:hypothetical protein